MLPHERSSESIELLEEERRLLFVGITRAREELRLSMATYREFRGQRRRTVPSQFTMELPRGEMEIVAPASGVYTEMELGEADDSGAWDAGGDVDFNPDEFSTSADEGPAARAEAAPMVAAPLVTAAELHRGARPEGPAVSPEVFHQGMIVRHPKYGLGKIVALSGRGIKRSATVAFASAAGEKKFMLVHSQLSPAKST